ncbi:uncharacterized protein LOC121380360 [Gigantopelta aegis]|uniref:uncharacterized protein LOC121380360 n=1 Tax=Gigantopelta aegis TaxID=1735272 RepID=UPI001B889F80|nr:uncharacterized protein LOC121380360 [Gigantopelta aegis]
MTSETGYTCWRRVCAFFFVTCILFDWTGALTCWHCIAGDCDINPSDNYKAIKKPCLPQQHCQKVYFEMYSNFDMKKYTSTVRSCAEECIPQDDFQNCTQDIFLTRGCRKKTCCANKDLCNSSSIVQQPFVLITVFLYTSVLVTRNL